MLYVSVLLLVKFLLVKWMHFRLTLLMTNGRSRRDTFRELLHRARWSSSSDDSPTWTLPSITPTVAGVAPSARTMDSTSFAVLHEHNKCHCQTVQTIWPDQPDETRQTAWIPQVVWIGHAMCNNSALKCNNRFVFCQRLWYRRMNSEETLWEKRSGWVYN